MSVEGCRIDIEGIIQGVGFRPFVYRLAQEKGLHGWVANHTQGVQIEVQGNTGSIRNFLLDLETKKPQQAEIHSIQTSSTVVTPIVGFTIRESHQAESPHKNALSSTPADSITPTVTVPPDMAPCEQCQREIFDTTNRRYLYPFTNCTDCGPRFTILKKLPYDRSNTSMQQFLMCDNCQQEYQNPADRRFHAEPTVCPDCGPQLQLCSASGEVAAIGNEALQQAARAIINGLVVAMKSVGGFQLMVDATNFEAVTRLRQKKQRPAKPFALLYPSIEIITQHCRVSVLEQELLLSSQRPIVLLEKTTLCTNSIAAAVAPGNPDLGVMLPASPLHYLLMAILQRPVVATSGNIAGEPICIDNNEAVSRLGPIADLLLLHDCTIFRPVDDSVVRVMNTTATLLRRSRGYVPLPLQLPEPIGKATMRPTLLAVGGQMKNTVALAQHNRVYLSQHLGDLDSVLSRDIFEQTIQDMSHFYKIEPAIIIHDQHPAYTSTSWAQSSKKTCIKVQHHVAHFFSCMAEHQHTEPALGVSWDGSGYGANGIILGGEFLFLDENNKINHLASMRPFPLPGGEQAIREPRRQAAGLLHELLTEDDFTVASILWQQFSSTEQFNLNRMLSRQINSPLCSSIGRLFDAVAALLGLAAHNTFEGQAAMALEACARSSHAQWHFPFEVLNPKPVKGGEQNPWIIDWGPMINALIDSQTLKRPRADIAAAFHNTLAEMIFAIVQRLGNYPVFLSGGVFQNRRLTETVNQLLQQRGHQVYHHQAVPANDGNIALGQIYYARCMENELCV